MNEFLILMEFFVSGAAVGVVGVVGAKKGWSFSFGVSQKNIADDGKIKALALIAENRRLREDLERTKRNLARVKDNQDRNPAPVSVTDRERISAIAFGSDTDQITDVQEEITGLRRQLSEYRAKIDSKNDVIARLKDQLKQTEFRTEKPVLVPPALVVNETSCNQGDKASVQWQLNGKLLTVPLPQSLVELKPWIDTYLAEKVALTPKALRCARDCDEYQNVALVYKALLLLGTRRDMLVDGGLETKQYFEEKLKELRLEIGSSMGSGSQSKFINRQYEMDYDGNAMIMDMALKRGNTRDPKRIMRIYFGCDKTRQKIVVGHLPTHLHNSIT